MGYSGHAPSLLVGRVTSPRCARGTSLSNHLPDPNAPVVFPRVAFYAGLATLIGGIVVAVAAAQVLLLVHVYGPWAPVPWVLLALGVICVPVGGSLTSARPWASWTAAALSWFAAALMVVWGVYAATQGFYALAPVFGALVAALGGALSLASIAPIGRYARWQRTLFEPEAPGLTPASDVYSASARRALPWPSLVAGLGAVAVGGAVFGVLEAPERAARLTTRLHLLVTARLPPSADGFVATRDDYPYPDSPFLEYLAYEGRFVQFDQDRVSAFADELAEDVGWRMLIETGEGDVEGAERALWARGDARRVPLWIAYGLRSRGVFYHEESLLSRSFDPDLHDEEGRVHLDCDQLAHLYEHVAWRLDLDLQEIQSPFHVYLRYSPPKDVSGDPLTVEATNFRRVDMDGNRVDFLGEGVGADYLIDPDYHSSGKSGTYASPELIAAAGLYQPATARDVSDVVVTNVIVGLKDRGIEAPYLDELRAHLDGTRSYALVSNAHTWTLDEADKAMALGEPAMAADLARQAIALRERFPHLVLTIDPEDQILLVRALVAMGDPDGARRELAEVLGSYQAQIDPDQPPMAETQPHARALLLAAQLDPPRDSRRCDETLGAVLRFDAYASGQIRDIARQACDEAGKHARICAAVLSACAAAY